MKFVHYILVNAVSRLSMDKNTDTYAFATHRFLSGYKQKCVCQCLAMWHPLLTWSSIADTNIVIYWGDN